jgi:aconitase B
VSKSCRFLDISSKVDALVELFANDIVEEWLKINKVTIHQICPGKKSAMKVKSRLLRKIFDKMLLYLLS